MPDCRPRRRRGARDRDRRRHRAANAGPRLDPDSPRRLRGRSAAGGLWCLRPTQWPAAGRAPARATRHRPSDRPRTPGERGLWV